MSDEWEQTLEAIEREHGKAIRDLVEREASAEAAARAAALTNQRRHDAQRRFKAPAGPSYPLGGGTWSSRPAKGAATRACDGNRVHHHYVDGTCTRCGYVRQRP